MSETPRRTLQESRYLPTEKSLAIMKVVARLTKEVETRFPEVYGVTFFGSRTTGLEKETSDMDIMVLYNGWKWEKQAGQLNARTQALKNKAFEAPAEEKMNAWKTWEEQNEREKAFLERRESYTRELHDTFTNKLEEFGIPVDPHAKEEGKAVFVIDVSPKKLRELFESFKLFVDHFSNHGTKDFIPNSADIITETFFRQLGILSLSTGNGIQEVRHNLLALYEHDPKGEFYFQALMKYLAYFEREASTPKRGPLPAFQHYPKTLQEARAYFRL